MNKYKIVFDRNKCEENRVCEAVCPKFWKFNDSIGKIVLKGSTQTKKGIFELGISEADYACNKEAVAGCPKKAIKIVALKEAKKAAKPKSAAAKPKKATGKPKPKKTVRKPKTAKKKTK